MEEEKKRESKFMISITGHNTHFEVPVNSMEDLERVDEILKVLKRKL